MQLFTLEKGKSFDSYAGTMTVSFAAAVTTSQCLSTETESLCFKRAVGRIRKTSQLFQYNALAGSIQNNIDDSIETIVRRMCEGSGDCFKSDGGFDSPNALDTNALDTSDDTREGSLRKAQFRL